METWEHVYLYQSVNAFYVVWADREERVAATSLMALANDFGLKGWEAVGWDDGNLLMKRRVTKST